MSGREGDWIGDWEVDAQDMRSEHGRATMQDFLVLLEKMDAPVNSPVELRKFVYDTTAKLLKEISSESPQEKIDGGLWTIPGGKVDPNEPIIDALFRETLEEVKMLATAAADMSFDIIPSGILYKMIEKLKIKLAENKK